MNYQKGFRLPVLIIICIVFVLILQSVWVNYLYRITCKQLMVDINEAFVEAYRKEQTYRIPVFDIVNPGSVTIESCSTEEEVHIIRKCPEPDTIVYNNTSGHSIESFMNRVFVDLREHIMPMNINCLADLFAGMLHEKNIPVYFVIERFEISTGKVLDSSLLPDKKQLKMKAETTIILEISEKESLRAIMQITLGVVLGQISGTFIITICLSLILLICLCALLRYIFLGNNVVAQLQPALSKTEFGDQNETFTIGQYIFDPAKNELYGYGESMQLNKKENTILYALCSQCGNVVERGILLSENWGNSGVIYSRSLDTYITTLRKYLKKDPSIQIVTIKGVGYKIVC